MGRKGHTIRPETVKRIIIYGVMLFLLSAFQCSFFARLNWLPATPDLILGALIAILVKDSQRTAAVAAIAGGFMLDAIGGIGISLSPIFYLLLIALVGGVSEKMLKSFPVWIALMIPALLLRAAYTCLRLYMSVGGFSMVEAFKYVLLPEAICTFVVCVPVYLLVYLCMLPLNKRRTRKSV